MKNNYTEVCKFRLTTEQKQILEKSSKEKNVSFSDFIRTMLFDPETERDGTVSIQVNLVKNAMYNKIVNSNYPKKMKEELIKELIENV